MGCILLLSRLTSQNPRQFTSQMFRMFAVPIWGEGYTGRVQLLKWSIKRRTINEFFYIRALKAAVYNNCECLDVRRVLHSLRDLDISVHTIE